MYRAAIIGAGGGRAPGHAQAYAHVPEAQLVAASSRDAGRLQAFGERHGIRARYTDYHEMLAREVPDLVHVNTPPHVRLEVLEAAAAAGVRALVVEKPVAIEAEDWQALCAFDAATGGEVKIAVNHQLHFHPRRAELQRRVGDGAIGDILFVDASAGMNLAYQGTHILQAVGAFHPGGVPASVCAHVGGAAGLADTPRKHFSPDHCLAAIAFEDGVRAQLQCGPHAPRVGREGIHTHKRIAVYGTRGFVHWWMWGWELSVDGTVDGGVHEYAEQDLLGQARMTQAMFRWLEDDGAVHPLHLRRALSDFGVILGIYTSALRREVVELPVAARPGLIAALRLALTETA